MTSVLPSIVRTGAPVGQGNQADSANGRPAELSIELWEQVILLVSHMRDKRSDVGCVVSLGLMCTPASCGSSTASMSGGVAQEVARSWR